MSRRGKKVNLGVFLVFFKVFFSDPSGTAHQRHYIVHAVISKDKY